MYDKILNDIVGVINKKTNRRNIYYSYIQYSGKLNTNVRMCIV
jgi:hypothetical protein